ncbi:UNVERIFIED_CONTAM: hypothetical protein K2H54_017184 [Gekko kuhli]
MEEATYDGPKQDALLNQFGGGGGVREPKLRWKLVGLNKHKLEKALQTAMAFKKSQWDQQAATTHQAITTPDSDSSNNENVHQVRQPAWPEDRKASTLTTHSAVPAVERSMSAATAISTP